MTYPSTINVAYLVEKPSCRKRGYDALKYGLCKLTRFSKKTAQNFSSLLKAEI